MRKTGRDSLALSMATMIIIICLVLAGATGSAGKGSQKAVDDNDDPGGGHGPYFQPPGNSYGHLSPLDRWIKTHREYTDYYEDPRESVGLGAQRGFSEIEDVEQKAVDIDTEEVDNILWDDEGNIIAYDYCMNGECYHVEDIKYDDKGDLESYTQTSIDRMFTLYYGITYDEQGRIISYYSESGGVVTMMRITRDEQGVVTDIAIEETSGKGSSTFRDWYLFSNILYDDLGRISGFSYMGSDSGLKMTTTVSNMDYDEQGLIFSYVQTITSSVEGLHTVTTRLNTEYDELGRVVGYRERTGTVSGDSQLNTWDCVETTYVYDMYGQVVGKSETISSNDSPDLVTTRNSNYDDEGRTEKLEILILNRTSGYAHYYSYNKLGQLDAETIIDQETGVMTDAEALRQALAGLCGEGMSQEELIEFFSDLTSGEIEEYIEVLKNGEGSGNRDNRSLVKKIHIDMKNVYEEEDYSHIAEWLAELTDDQGQKDSGQ